jgi:hypothetical protein
VSSQKGTSCFQTIFLVYFLNPTEILSRASFQGNVLKIGNNSAPCGQYCNFVLLDAKSVSTTQTILKYMILISYVINYHILV